MNNSLIMQACCPFFVPCRISATSTEPCSCAQAGDPSGHPEKTHRVRKPHPEQDREPSPVLRSPRGISWLKSSRQATGFACLSKRSATPKGIWMNFSTCSGRKGSRIRSEKRNKAIFHVSNCDNHSAGQMTKRLLGHKAEKYLEQSYKKAVPGTFGK